MFVFTCCGFLKKTITHTIPCVIVYEFHLILIYIKKKLWRDKYLIFETDLFFACFILGDDFFLPFHEKTLMNLIWKANEKILCFCRVFIYWQCGGILSAQTNHDFAFGFIVLLHSLGNAWELKFQHVHN